MIMRKAPSRKRPLVGVLGNPNCGKTTLFNSLTGGKQRVGNWAGVTVEKIQGIYSHNDYIFDLIDLPGIYSLSTSSLDEQVTRDFIINEKPDLIINIIDASNLERNLYLTVQLMEMRIPLLIILNKMDILKQKNIKIKIDDLGKLLDIPIMCTVANRNQGIDSLKDFIDHGAFKHQHSHTHIYYSDEVETAIANIIDELRAMKDCPPVNERWMAIKLLEDDITAHDRKHFEPIKTLIDKERVYISQITGEDTDISIAECRYGFINSICKRVIDKSNIIRKTITDSIDKVVLNRFLGLPIFFAAMFLTFWVTINVGGCFIDFFDIMCGTLFVDAFKELLFLMHAPQLVITFFADGLGGGVQTIATFIPPIFFMFLCLSLLEDSGYMARAGFIMDRIMRFIGLPGKAFVPMLVGFGCNVPAILATRTLDDEKDRILTIMMNPFMSCGARMPVYAVFAAAFFPDLGGIVVFSLYVIGIFVAILTAFILKWTILKGEAAPFIMELPPYHIPTVKGTFIHTWERLKTFIVRAGKAIILVVLILTFMNTLGTDGSFGNENTEKSLLSAIGKSMTPVFKPMGIREDNWPATVGIFTGIFAKESVVATLDTLYNFSDVEDASEDHQRSILESLADACLSIPSNVVHITMPFSLGDIFGTANNVSAENKGMAESTHAALRLKFDGRAGAFSYLLLILLYMPCVAALAAVYRELNWKWAFFSMSYMTAIAWAIATLFYQTMRFSLHPFQSLFWYAIIAGGSVVFLVILKIKGPIYK
jgi:ferrous iron transport protein B